MLCSCLLFLQHLSRYSADIFTSSSMSWLSMFSYLTRISVVLFPIVQLDEFTGDRTRRSGRTRKIDLKKAWDMVRGGGWQGAAAARRSWWRLRLAHGARSPRSWGERSGGRAGSAGPRRPPAGVGRGAVTDGCGAALLRRAHGASAGRQVLSLSAPRPPPRSPQRRRAPRPQRGEVSGWRAARGGGIPAPPRGREQNGEPRRDGAGGWRPSGFPGAGVT